MFNMVGVTQRVLCDKGSCFTSKLVNENCNAMDIKVSYNTTATPRTNDQAERFGVVKGSASGRLVQKNPSNLLLAECRTLLLAECRTLLLAVCRTLLLAVRRTLLLAICRTLLLAVCRTLLLAECRTLLLAVYRTLLLAVAVLH
jgi:hypothetical protein